MAEITGATTSRAPAAAATLTSSTTSFITWAVTHYAFRGQIPPEVFGFLQFVIPTALGWAGGCLTQRRQERAARAARAPPDMGRPPPVCHRWGPLSRIPTDHQRTRACAALPGWRAGVSHWHLPRTQVPNV